MKRIFSFLLMLVLLLSMASAESEDSLQILSTERLSILAPVQNYMADGHDVSVRVGSYNDIVTAISTKDPDVDIFIFLTRDGLDQIKRLKYYYPLTGNEALMARVDDLYPVFKSALMDGDDLVGWYIDAQAWGWQVMEPQLLEEAELEAPTTFDELLDVCNALLDSGLLGNDYTLIAEYLYTQENIMKFYMTQYLMASEMNDGQVNFLRPEFARTVSKIRETVPATKKENTYANYTVFASSSASTGPNTHIELIPSPLDGAPSRLYYLAVIAIINPYSDNVDAAMDLMTYLAADTSEGSYLWDSSRNQPHIYDNYDEMIANLQAEIAAYEALDKLSEEDELSLDYARHRLQYYIDDPYDIHEEDVAYYQSVVENAYVSGDSPVSLDDTLETLIKRYLAGAFDAEEFARECQKHVNSIYLEMGMEVINVP